MLTWNRLSYSRKENCLRAVWYRSKTSTKYTMLVVMSPDKPYRCALFSLGAMMREEHDINAVEVFPRPNVAKVLNGVLKVGVSTTIVLKLCRLITQRI